MASEDSTNGLHVTPFQPFYSAPMSECRAGRRRGAPAASNGCGASLLLRAARTQLFSGGNDAAPKSRGKAKKSCRSQGNLSFAAGSAVLSKQAFHWTV